MTSRTMTPRSTSLRALTLLALLAPLCVQGVALGQTRDAPAPAPADAANRQDQPGTGGAAPPASNVQAGDVQTGETQAGEAQAVGVQAVGAQAATPAEAVAAPVNPYCEAVVDAAADARFAWQAQTLEAMRLEIEERAAQLEQKRAETEQWLTRRQEFLDRTEAHVVAIYARMRADAAAAQIAAMQDDAAVALLSKIDVRAASAILNEMEPRRAAHLTNVVTGVLRRTAQNRPQNEANAR